MKTRGGESEESRIIEARQNDAFAADISIHHIMIPWVMASDGLPQLHVARSIAE